MTDKPEPVTFDFGQRQRMNRRLDAVADFDEAYVAGYEDAVTDARQASQPTTALRALRGRAKAVVDWADSEPEDGTRKRISTVLLDGLKAALADTGHVVTPESELRAAAVALVDAHEAHRDAINGQGHEGPHDDVLAPGGHPMAGGGVWIDAVGDCSACGGAQYGTEHAVSQALGDLRALLGYERRPWEEPGHRALVTPESGQGDAALSPSELNEKEGG